MLEILLVKYGIQVKDSGIPLVIGIRIWNLESKFYGQIIRNPIPGIWNPRREIQNPRLSWIL